MKVIYSDANKSLLDYFIKHINRKAIADCVLKLLNLYTASFDDGEIKLYFIGKLIDSLNIGEFGKQFEKIRRKYNLPLIKSTKEFDLNKFYYLQERLDVKFYYHIF